MTLTGSVLQLKDPAISSFETIFGFGFQ